MRHHDSGNTDARKRKVADDIVLNNSQGIEHETEGGFMLCLMFAKQVKWLSMAYLIKQGIYNLYGKDFAGKSSRNVAT